jgi:hypothetical protein
MDLTSDDVAMNLMPYDVLEAASGRRKCSRGLRRPGLGHPGGRSHPRHPNNRDAYGRRGGVVRGRLAVQSRGRLRFDFRDPRRCRQGHLARCVIAGKTDGAAGTAVTIADPGGVLVALWTPFAGKT